MTRDGFSLFSLWSPLFDTIPSPEAPQNLPFRGMGHCGGLDRAGKALLIPAVGIGQQVSGMGSVLINPQRWYCFNAALIGAIKLNSAS